MSPLAITTLLRVWLNTNRPEPKPCNIEGIRQCREAKLISFSWMDGSGHDGYYVDGNFTVTPRGHAMITALINLPLPQMEPSTFFIPNTDIKISHDGRTLIEAQS